MRKIFSKILTKTDIKKRLHVPSVKKKCFLNFRAGQHEVKFEAIDKNGKVWPFFCSIRKKKGDYPKPVLSKGWLRFVRCWKPAIGDEVILYLNHDKAGKDKGHYRIEVIKRATEKSWVLSPPVQDHDTDRTMAEASDNNVEEEPTLTSNSNSSGQAMSYDQSEGFHNQPVTDRVGLKFVLISLKHDMQIIREPKFINLIELGIQDRSEKDQPSFTSQNHTVESPITSSTVPYYKFL